jgi:hypothetical protein
MKANEKEIACIIYVEKIFKKKGLKNLYQRFFKSSEVEKTKTLFNKSYEVEKTKTLFNLWRLHGCEGYNMAQAKRIDCINHWIKILYDLDYNIESEIKKEAEFIKADQKRLRDEAEKNNHRMVRKNYGDLLERALMAFDEEFGNYQN